MPPPSYVTDIAPPKAITPIAAQGFANGALRFGIISFATHFVLNRYTPVYRGLTIQFKVFIQLSAMTLGGCIFAERAVGGFNEEVRKRRRSLARSQRVWEEEEEIRQMVETRAKLEEVKQREVKGKEKGK